MAAMAARAKRRHRHDPRDVVAEIVRRATPSGHLHVVRLSDPPTERQRLQLMAARLLRTPIVVMPMPCNSINEWMERYATRMADC
jgi:hypothetical protein